jgi:hypothetical protein
MLLSATTSRATTRMMSRTTPPSIRRGCRGQRPSPSPPSHRCTPCSVRWWTGRNQRPSRSRSQCSWGILSLVSYVVRLSEGSDIAARAVEDYSSHRLPVYASHSAKVITPLYSLQCQQPVPIRPRSQNTHTNSGVICQSIIFVMP